MPFLVLINDIVNNRGDANVSLDNIAGGFVAGSSEFLLSGEDLGDFKKIKVDDFDKTSDEVELVVDLSTFSSDFELDLKDERAADTLTLQGADEVVISNNGTRTITFTGADGATHELVVNPTVASIEIARDGGVEIGPGIGLDNLEGGVGDDTISGGAGHDTIEGGAGNDNIVSGVNETELGGSGERSYDFPLIRLGQAADIDPDETDGVSENADDLLGTYGGDGNPLSGSIIFAVSNDLNQDDNLDDNDSGRTAETFTINGEELALDSVQVYNAQVEFVDGTSGTFTAVVIQLENGEFFLAPEPMQNADSALLTSGEIESITLQDVVVDNTNLYGLRLDMAYKVGDDDSVDGGSGDDTITAGVGDDIVEGGAGADQVFGGAGADRLFGGSGDDVLTGGSGDDYLKVGSGNDAAYGGAGGDTLQNASGDDLLYGGSGDDNLIANVGNDTLFGGQGDDTLTGGSGDDSLDGGAARDTLFGGSGDDTLDGGSGNDEISAGSGNDVIEGGNGDDSILAASGDDIVTDSGGAGSFDTIFGGRGADTLSSGQAADNVFGGSGDDRIDGQSGDDTLSGGSGDDTILGGAGSDQVDGGGGLDFIDYSASSSGVVVDLTNTGAQSGGDAQGDTLFGIDGAYGSSSADTILGFDGEVAGPGGYTNIFYGGGGGDSLDGRGGSDTIYGGSGDDTVSGGFGADTLYGGQGVDTIYSSSGDDLTYAGSGDDEVFGNAGADTIFGGAGQDYIHSGSGDDNFFGGLGADTAYGGTGGDSLVGGVGADTLYGGSGDDSLEGGSGDDLLTVGAGQDSAFGGAGADTITNSSGNDSLVGGSGDDSFTITDGFGTDTIVGGEGGSDDDTLDFSGLSSGVDVTFSGDELGNATDGTDTLTFTEIESVILTSQADTVDARFQSMDLRIESASGDDFLQTWGTDGANNTNQDTIFAGHGADTVEAGGADDLIYGGDGADLISSGFANSGDTIFGGAGADTIDTFEHSTSTTSGVGDEVHGESGDDSITGSTGSFSGDTIFGGEGADTIVGLGGDDTLSGGSGSDSILGGTGADSIVGGSGNDFLNGGSGDDLLDGGSGDDTFRLEDAGSDTIFGGAGYDVIDLEGVTTSGVFATNFDGIEEIRGSDFIGGDIWSWAGGDVSFFGGLGGDTVTAGSGDDTLIGGSGDDSLSGGTGDDSIEGGSGDDVISVGTGQDTAFGGAGDDTISNASGDDSLVGGSGDDSIVATDGADTLEGGAGADTLIGGTGDDSLVGGSGDDVITGSSGDDVAFGGAGQDTFLFSDGFGNDTIQGGEDGTDLDTLDFSSLSGPVTVTFTGNEQGTVTDGTDTLTFSEIERFILTSGDDVVFASNSISRSQGAEIFTGQGNDTVSLGNSGAADTIYGGSGDDSLDAGDGKDELFGGAGDDTLLANFDDGTGDLFDGGSGDDSYQIRGSDVDGFGFNIDLDAGSDTFGNQYVSIEEVIAGSGDDTLSGASGNETLDGGGGDDSITGNGGADRLIGGSGDDSIDGGSGDDSLAGGAGADSLSGGENDDTVEGGSGDDTLDGGEKDDSLTGGEGFDTFVISDGNDTISDFGTATGAVLNDGDQTNNDFVDLSAFYDNISEVRGDFDDDGILNQSNATDDKGRTVDFSDNTAMSGGTTFQGVASSDEFTQDNTNVVCFAEGTMIATPAGDVPVEHLKTGDLVKTVDHQARPIAWIGHQKISSQHAAAREDLRAVRISAGALGLGLPQKDLVVSPQHRMLISGPIAKRMFGAFEILTPAKALIGAPGVSTVDTPEDIHLVHFMFETHEIVFADGAPSETFFPGPTALSTLSAPDRGAVLNCLSRISGGRRLTMTPARQFVKVKDGEALVARHLKNGKPLLGHEKLRQKATLKRERATKLRSRTLLSTDRSPLDAKRTQALISLGV